MAPPAMLSLILALSFSVSTASKNLVVEEQKQTRHAFLSKQEFKHDILNAMDAMLGCGGKASDSQLAAVRKTLMPMWETLPKTTPTSGRVDRRSLRYLVHRYFMQTSSLMVRGFEPTRPVNESHWGVADILSQMVPAYVEAALESNHAKVNGFSMNDAVTMTVMLEQLIFDSESSLLMKVYNQQQRTPQRSLTEKGLMQVLENYVVQWMVDADDEDMALLLSNRSLLEEVVPLYGPLVDFAAGRVKMLKYQRNLHPQNAHGNDVWNNKYSFEDAHQIVGGMTKSFQSFWQSECETMHDALVGMDTHHTGRVPLAKFYNTAINSDWRFGESEQYLRELGALDETSALTGAQVIIPNYIQATSNCIISTSHYLVCCRNHCEDILGEIELAIGAPTATPEEILEVVGNISIGTDDEEPDLKGSGSGSLAEQLETLALSQGGRVPLHGRLFAQWLHYVFPRECAFPHLMGAVSAVTPQQFGDDYVATVEDMEKHAVNASTAGLPEELPKEELQWMSQWSPEEELMVDYTSEFRMSWEKRTLLIVAGLALLAFGITGGVVTISPPKSASSFDQKCFI